MAAVRATFARLGVTNPYRFQEQVAGLLLEGHNVILVAPTGCGKTVAAIAPFVHAHCTGKPFADRLIYALPLRTLATTLFDGVRALLEPLGLRVTLQMGNRPEDPFFQGDVIFTTIDQILSAYINVPVSLRPGLANLPAGAIIGAYLVFDEFHLLEPEASLATLLDMADRFSAYTRLLLMSATVPGTVSSELSRRAHAVEYRVSPQEAADLPGQVGKIRRFHWMREPLSVQAVLDRLGDRTLVVCNTVERAQGFYEELLGAIRWAGISIPFSILLHSRFLPEDRALKERQLVERFGKGARGKGLVVATQVVEVGLDVSFDVLHTEVAPANALVQRAGRCARFAGESGDVYVYPLERDAGGRPRYGPYGELADEVEATAAALSGCVNGRAMTFHEELMLLDEVHGAADLRRLVAVSPHERRSRVNQAIVEGGGAYVRELVRDVQAVNVVVHPDPGQLDWRRRPQQFSVAAPVFHGFVRSLDLTGQDAGAVFTPRFGDAEGYDGGPRWEPLRDHRFLDSMFLAAISPCYASYDPEIGLRLRKGDALQPGGFIAAETLPYGAGGVGSEPLRYHRETYADHVRRIRLAFRRQGSQHRAGAERLAAALGITREHLDVLCELTAALHDVGKLAEEWQAAIWRWQTDLFGEPRNGFLAHSECDPSLAEHRQRLADPRYRRPPHASEGAYAVSKMLEEVVQRVGVAEHLVGEAVGALVSAIARHHAARTREVGYFTLSAGASAAVAETLDIPEANVTILRSPIPADRALFPTVLAGPRDAVGFPLYLYIVRRLRLADWESFRVEESAGGLPSL